MGCKISKNWERGIIRRQRSQEEGNADLELESGVTAPGTDLSSDEAAYRADPELRNLEATIQQRTSRAINSIAIDIDVGEFSMDSLRYVTECLLEMNQDLVSVILQSKKDVWKNPELSDLVDEYFKNSIQSLDFCSLLDACLKRALISQSRINLALHKFKEEHFKAEIEEGSSSSSSSSNIYSKTLGELRNFKEAGQPFTEELFALFQAVCKQQMSMLEKLQIPKKKLDKKIGRLKTWKKVTNVIFVTAFVSVLICSVVAAAVTAPPVVTALTAAASVPLGSMGKWLNSVWTKWEKELKSQSEIIFTVQIGSYVVIKDLDNIRVLVEKVQIEIEALMQNAEFAVTEDDAVAIAMNEMKKKFDGFTETIQDLSVRADKCGPNINGMRTMILKSIINQRPSSSSSGNSLLGTFFSF